MATTQKTTRTKAAAKTTRKTATTTRRRKIDGGTVIALREEVNAYKKELILRAAVDTFYEHGYHDTTVDMLAERLDGTKAIFYYYYTDKRAVLDEIYKRSLSSAQAVIRQAIDAGGPPSQVLSTFARLYTIWVIDNQHLVDVFWREERTLSREVRAEVAAEQKKFDDLLAGIIRDGVAKGEFHVQDVRTTARAVSGMISFLYTWWQADRRLTREDAANYYAELALRLVTSQAQDA